MTAPVIGVMRIDRDYESGIATLVYQEDVFQPDTIVERQIFVGDFVEGYVDAQKILLGTDSAYVLIHGQTVYGYREGTYLYRCPYGTLESSLVWSSPMSVSGIVSDCWLTTVGMLIRSEVRVTQYHAPNEYIFVDIDGKITSVTPSLGIWDSGFQSDYKVIIGMACVGGDQLQFVVEERTVSSDQIRLLPPVSVSDIAEPLDSNAPGYDEYNYIENPEAFALHTSRGEGAHVFGPSFARAFIGGEASSLSLTSSGGQVGTVLRSTPYWFEISHDYGRRVVYSNLNNDAARDEPVQVMSGFSYLVTGGMKTRNHVPPLFWTDFKYAQEARG